MRNRSLLGSVATGAVLAALLGALPAPAWSQSQAGPPGTHGRAPAIPPLSTAEAGAALDTVGSLPASPAEPSATVTPPAAEASRLTPAVVPAAASPVAEAPVAGSPPPGPSRLASAPSSPDEAMPATQVTPAQPASTTAASAEPSPVPAAAPPAMRPVPMSPSDAADLALNPGTAADPATQLSAAVGRSLFDRLHRDAPAPGLTRADLAALREFYSERADQPVWSAGGRPTPAATAVRARLARADEDGLDPAAYAAGGFEALTGPSADPARAAEAELNLSAAVLAYARQAAGGRVNPARIGKDIVADQHLPDPLGVLVTVTAVSDPTLVLDGYNPVQPEYAALREALARLRGTRTDAVSQAEPAPIPRGPLLKPGMKDARVAALRARLGLASQDDGVRDDSLYDPELVAAIQAFQQDHTLKANGVVGPQTIAALNGGTGTEDADTTGAENELIANMERWRWMPRDLGNRHILVNVPQFHLEVVENGAVSHEARVVVGKPTSPTPLFSDRMQFVVFNPSWTVPQSIIRKEYLPKLANDPDYLHRHGFVVTYKGGQMQVRQPPGEDNALGHIKFMFPNNFSVYLHDTSQRKLFSAERRAFSHGCVRVDDPYKLAEIVMGVQNGWTEDRVEGMIGGAERRVNLVEAMPVHIAYFTAQVDASGTLQRYQDLYGYDKKVLAALGLSS